MKLFATLALLSLMTSAAFANDLVIPDSANAMSDNALSDARGGQHVYDIAIDYVETSSEMQGITAGNTALNTVSGNNIITNGALGGTSGITNVIQNTGSNVLIQNSTVVHLTLQP
uniref:hypothetical protein n=1 Tax=Thaumasiovibrio occultus TaxID=1891184 RepID=UPI000B360976|nr:hypothetical protein [Thaumasiovibrio occultus]